MASKQVEIIEVPDDDPDDFPNSGPQKSSGSPVIQGQDRCHHGYVQQSLGWWLQRCPEVDQSCPLKKLMVKHWWTDGRGWCRGCDEVNPWPQLCLPASTSHHGRHQHDRASDRGTWGVDLPQAAARKGVEDRGLGANCDVPLITCWRHTLTCHCLQPTCCPWPRSLTLRPSTWSWRQLLDWWFRSTSQSITWVWYKIYPWKWLQKRGLAWLERVLLPQVVSLTQEPWYRPTQLLAAAVWLNLKHKFFNGGMAKEACTTFEVQAKQLSKLLLGKVYLGGSGGAAKGKRKRSHTMAHEGDVAGDDPFPPTKKWMRHQNHSSSLVHLQWGMPQL